MNSVSTDGGTALSSSSSAGDAENKAKLLDKASYVPPIAIRILRVSVPSIAGLLAIGLFTFAYYQSYERTNQAIFDNYVAEFYEQQNAEPAPPPPTVDELLEETFNPPATLAEDALSDLRSFQYVVSQQLAGVENLSIERKGSVVFFRHDRREYTLDLMSTESYKYIDDYVEKSKVG